MWPFAMVLAAILLAFAIAAYWLEGRVRDQALTDRVLAVRTLLKQKIAKDADLMQATLRALMANRVVRDALQRQDRDALQRELGSLFATLRDQHRITHLYVNDANLVNVLRLHSPVNHGDVISRFTATRARDTGQPVHGLELGPLGTLTLRLVMPWQVDGRVIGYLEMGEEIGYVVDELHDSLGVDSFVLVDKRFILHRQWQYGLELLQRLGQWEQFDNRVLVAQTTAQFPPAISAAVLTRLRQGATEVIQTDGKAMHLAMLPLLDVAGQPIGELVVMRDIEGLQQTFFKSVLSVIGLSLAAGLGVLALFYVALGRVDRDYQRQHDLEHQLLRLDNEHQRIVQLEKMSALGTMVGEIAHQLNNPLVGVVNLAQLAAREADDPARTRELLAEIRRAGEDCHAFITSMLRFAKVSKFERHATDLAQVVQETVLMFRQTVQGQIQVEMNFPEEAVVLEVDPILLRHALFNLLLNAAQATEGAGAIQISLQAQPHPDTGAPGWVLTVRDHGKGIAPEILDQVFSPFFTTRRDGTGLGLPVVQHVALLHQGFVSVENLPEGGTQFAIWLPQTHSTGPISADQTKPKLTHVAQDIGRR
ncbi:ATP-binding protein [Rhodoferax sp.]|uniref:ATP-binding protein n=1 Tax=Rhodoferax sp. TaxID=50421 RepID=UPI0026220EC6|nr:ATP-binding protein [Rhodoferax sp.]MDD2918399.1 ATP-binding protein [Rhodoferax sp.]